MQKESITSRLENLRVDTQALFGIMTPQHMIEHLILTVKLSYGKIKIPDFEPNEKQVAQKQALLHSDILFPRGVKAPGLPDQLIDLRFPNLETAKEEFIKCIGNYHNAFKENEHLTTTHPRFGKLTFEEWEKFHAKHFEHHLGQFGC